MNVKHTRRIKLSEEDIDNIKKLYDSGVAGCKICSIYGFSYTTLYRVIAGVLTSYYENDKKFVKKSVVNKELKQLLKDIDKNKLDEEQENDKFARCRKVRKVGNCKKECFRYKDCIEGKTTKDIAEDMNYDGVLMLYGEVVKLALYDLFKPIPPLIERGDINHKTNKPYTDRQVDYKRAEHYRITKDRAESVAFFNSDSFKRLNLDKEYLFNHYQEILAKDDRYNYKKIPSSKAFIKGKREE